MIEHELSQPYFDRLIVKFQPPDCGNKKISQIQLIDAEATQSNRASESVTDLNRSRPRILCLTVTKSTRHFIQKGYLSENNHSITFMKGTKQFKYL